MQAAIAWAAEEALQRLARSIKSYPASGYETYFTANGENYRIRIERIPDGKPDAKQQ